MEYPPSPKDAFRETCEFYGDPAFTKRRHPRRYEMQMNGFVNGGGSVKLQRAKPKKLEFYKSDSKLSNHVGAESSSEEMENFINPISRSKSLHDLEHCKPQPRPAAGEAGEQVAGSVKRHYAFKYPHHAGRTVGARSEPRAVRAGAARVGAGGARRAGHRPGVRQPARQHQEQHQREHRTVASCSLLRIFIYLFSSLTSWRAWQVLRRRRGAAAGAATPGTGASGTGCGIPGR